MNAKTVALMVIPLISIRVAYMAFPSLWLATGLWLVAAAMVVAWAHLLRRRSIPLYGAAIVGLGALMNGLVMLVNGGIMPVHGATEEIAFGAWKSAEDGGHLLFLGDRMSWGGASPGDFLILTGLTFSLGIVAVRVLRSRFGTNRMAAS